MVFHKVLLLDETYIYTLFFHTYNIHIRVTKNLKEVMSLILIKCFVHQNYLFFFLHSE
jgi:hypothetical protein